MAGLATSISLRNGKAFWAGVVYEKGSKTSVKISTNNRKTEYDFTNSNAAKGFLESTSRAMLRKGYRIETARKNPTGFEKHLEYHNDALNSHKYWSVWITDSNVFVEYGRMPGYGTKNQQQEKSKHNYNSELEATQYATKKIAEKIRKGYSETKWHNVGIANPARAIDFYKYE